MPQSSVLARAPRFATLDTLVQLKKYWVVSVAALAYRLHALRILTDWHYRTLCIEIARRGWRTSEPDSAQRETSQVLAKVIGSLRDEQIFKEDISAAINVPVAELEKLMFGLVVMGIDGGKATKTGSSSRAIFRLVDS